MVAQNASSLHSYGGVSNNNTNTITSVSSVFSNPRSGDRGGSPQIQLFAENSNNEEKNTRSPVSKRKIVGPPGALADVEVETEAEKLRRKLSEQNSPQITKQGSSPRSASSAGEQEKLLRKLAQQNSSPASENKLFGRVSPRSS